MNEHENQTMKIFGKRLTASLLGAALVMSMPFASALTQKNITVERGVTVYVDDQKLNPGDANGNSVEPMLYNGTTYLPIRAGVSRSSPRGKRLRCIGKDDRGTAI